MSFLRRFSSWYVVLFTAALTNSSPASAPVFEARQTRPLAISDDGRTLVALQSGAGRLSVFRSGSAGRPIPLLVSEIPVGLAPVSVSFRTADEVWVVNELSDSISVVSLEKRAVIASLPTGDEPSDLVFAGDLAFVCCARDNTLAVYSAASRERVGTIPLEGLVPSSLAVSPDGRKIYAAFLHSGNGTTILRASVAPGQGDPENTDLPVPPRTARIVGASDPAIGFTLLDHDIAQVDVRGLTVDRYIGSVGTNLFGMAVSPGDGRLFVTNSEAKNLRRFEPQLRGTFAANRLTVVDPGSGAVSPLVLDPPEATASAVVAEETKKLALAQPAAVIAAGTGELWLAAFGSDRVAKLDIVGEVPKILARTDLRTGGVTSVRGPRGLATHPTLPHLYVANKLSATLSVVDTETYLVLGEIPLGSAPDHPAGVTLGRGHLYDARLSGNGTVSCATCHIDADRDGLAWDLGNPAGEMVAVAGINFASDHNDTPRTRDLHPMKGPMVTQTLRGIGGQDSFHWRGDKASIEDFNATFEDLLAGSRLDTDQMGALANYIRSLSLHPNPHRNLERTLRQTVPITGGGAAAVGDAVRGRLQFLKTANHCIECHHLPTGSSGNIDDHRLVASTQPVKNAPLSTVYQRAHYNPRGGATSITGYGMNHDGSGFSLPRGHFYDLDFLEGDDFADVSAFVLSFDTGTAPAVGRGVTITGSGALTGGSAETLEILEAQASGDFAGCDLIAHSVRSGRQETWVYSPGGANYHSDQPDSEPLTRDALIASLAGGDVINFLGVPPGEAAGLGPDRNRDGMNDRHSPAPRLALTSAADGSLRLRWETVSPAWFPEAGGADLSEWLPAPAPQRAGDGGSSRLEMSPDDTPAAFFRLRRTY